MLHLNQERRKRHVAEEKRNCSRQLNKLQMKHDSEMKAAKLESDSKIKEKDKLIQVQSSALLIYSFDEHIN